jgi:hypothetical protein
MKGLRSAAPSPKCHLFETGKRLSCLLALPQKSRPRSHPPPGPPAPRSGLFVTTDRGHSETLEPIDHTNCFRPLQFCHIWRGEGQRQKQRAAYQSGPSLGEEFDPVDASSVPSKGQSPQEMGAAYSSHWLYFGLDLQPLWRGRALFIGQAHPLLSHVKQDSPRLSATTLVCQHQTLVR